MGKKSRRTKKWKHNRWKKRKSPSMLRWILNRTLLIFGAKVGGGCLIGLATILGIGSLLTGYIPILILSVILGLVGTFLLLFSTQLSKWIELR